MRLLLVFLLLLVSACGGDRDERAATQRHDCLAAWNEGANPHRGTVPETMGAATVSRWEMSEGDATGCSYMFHDWGRYVSFSGRWTADGLEWQPGDRGVWTAAQQHSVLDDHVVIAGGRLRPLAEASRSWRHSCVDVGAHGDRTYELCREPGRPGVQRRRTNPGALVVEESGARTVIHLEPPRAASDFQPPVGHWERALLSPDGRTLLLQWSAECEVRYTFLAAAEGGTPRPALRPRPKWWDAPSSIAVGWASPRVAVVETVPACGSGDAERRRVRVAVGR